MHEAAGGLAASHTSSSLSQPEGVYQRRKQSGGGSHSRAVRKCSVSAVAQAHSAHAIYQFRARQAQAHSSRSPVRRHVGQLSTWHRPPVLVAS